MRDEDWDLFSDTHQDLKLLSVMLGVALERFDAVASFDPLSEDPPGDEMTALGVLIYGAQRIAQRAASIIGEAL